MAESMIFNGINGATGEYLLPELPVSAIARIARGEALDPEALAELKSKYRWQVTDHLAVREGVDPTDLAQTGWGVVFAHADGDAVDARREALKPLLDLRREQAGDLYREYTGADAYRPGESKNGFLSRHGMGPGPADPEKVPYYLLIVADPDTIDFRFQFLLDVAYAVGRIHFPRLEDYANYARTVVASETQPARRSRSLAFFGVQNHADAATQMSARDLVAPLAESLAANEDDWRVITRLKDQARKSDLVDLLREPDGPALLFTASHGMGFPNGHERQLPHQGALLCQDWPGPLRGRGRPISPDEYFSVDDLPDVRVDGLVAFCFACYGAGTPKLDYFAHRATAERTEIAPRSFIASLPVGMLADPRGGALAVIGHVERAWGYSFNWPGAGPQLAVFEDTILRMLYGHPVGSAIEFFNDRYAELSTLLSDQLEEIHFGNEPSDNELAGLWTANNDARSYTIVGDPAVRLPQAPADE
jgi:hypothetical protein